MTAFRNPLVPLCLTLALGPALAGPLVESEYGDGSLVDPQGNYYYPQRDGSLMDAYGHAYSPNPLGVYTDAIGDAIDTPQSGSLLESGPGALDPSLSDLGRESRIDVQGTGSQVRTGSARGGALSVPWDQQGDGLGQDWDPLGAEAGGLAAEGGSPVDPGTQPPAQAAEELGSMYMKDAGSAYLDSEPVGVQSDLPVGLGRGMAGTARRGPDPFPAGDGASFELGPNARPGTDVNPETRDIAADAQDRRTWEEGLSERVHSDANTFAYPPERSLPVLRWDSNPR